MNADGTVSPGATIDIYIRLTTDGQPANLGEVASRIAHELVHALGDPIFDPASVQTRWSDDGFDLLVSVNGVQEALFESASGAGALEGMEIDGVLFATSAFSSAVNSAPWADARGIDVFGTFCGGHLASGATSDIDFDLLVYELGSVSGAYADRDWRVDPRTGDIQANFFKEDRLGNEYTVVTLVVSDGLTTSNVEVTIRWAYSLEPGPQPERAFDPVNEPDVVLGALGYPEHNHLIVTPEFG